MQGTVTRGRNPKTDTTRWKMAGEEELDVLDLLEENDAGDAVAPQSHGDRRIGSLSKSVNELRTQFSEIKGILLAQKGSEKAVEERPEFDSKDEEYLWTLTQQYKRQEAELAAMKAERESEKQGSALSKAVGSALKGLNFGDEDKSEFARSSMEMYLKQHPKADQEEVKKYAVRLARITGAKPVAGRDYAEKKREDAARTQRPTQSAGGKPTGREDLPPAPKSKREEFFGPRGGGSAFDKARERAAARLLASEE